MIFWLAATAQVLFTALCVSLVGLFLILVCIPRLHTPVRAWLRPLAVHHVERGLEVVVAAQKYQAPWLTSLFTKSSHSVSVTFYVSHSGRGGAVRACMAVLHSVRAAQRTAVAAAVARATANRRRRRRCLLCPQASFLPMLFWLGLPELGRNLVFLVSPCRVLCGVLGRVAHSFSTPPATWPSLAVGHTKPPRADACPSHPTADDPLPVRGQRNQGPGVCPPPPGPHLRSAAPQVPGGIR
jgi:hypothetical protein